MRRAAGQRLERSSDKARVVAEFNDLVPGLNRDKIVGPR